MKIITCIAWSMFFLPIVAVTNVYDVVVGQLQNDLKHHVVQIKDLSVPLLDAYQNLIEKADNSGAFNDVAQAIENKKHPVTVLPEPVVIKKPESIVAPEPTPITISPEIQKIVNQYPDVFVDVPQKHWPVIADLLSDNALGNLHLMQSKTPNRYNEYVHKYRWYGIGEFYGCLPSDTNAGYTFFKPDFCTGERLEASFDRAYGTNKNNVMKVLVQDYKIHLMPKGDMAVDLIALIELIRDDKELQKSINSFKLKNRFNDDEMIIAGTEGKEVMPKIVIYCASGKEQAQTALNKIYDAFKDREGLDVTPRFNQKITSYIYYAQGNGDDKKIYSSFFEPDKIHYRKDVTEENQDYHLKIPSK